MALLRRTLSFVSSFIFSAGDSTLHDPNLNCSIRETQDLEVKTIIDHFLRETSYETPKVTFDINRLKKAILDEISTWNDPRYGSLLYERIADHAAGIVECSYVNHTFDAKLQFGLYSWSVILIDDLSKRMPSAITEFQQRILLNQPQVDPALDRFPQILNNLYLHWDPVCANMMVCSAYDFIVGTILEDRRMVPHQAAIHWPKFLRLKSGVANAYALATFPKDRHPDLSVYVQALPDMSDFINFVNDILSFYKEDLTGDDMNYVGFSARLSGKTSLQVVSELIEEVVQSHRRIVDILADQPETLKWWLTFEQGYIAWHLSSCRYKLSEIGLHM
ncbi:hypothetical protein D9758_008417 [Tetrapyrgos nigripes]|uniref:Trichodiene synthase n=1 Tax=Tetrapyrgos nigripes TaxID=182062 RepID=A0A8H5CNX6_9AGAR|nr:hypothetical protein D9758_008417 [Tetrapyrgos nigripes]